jgi:hypothetical protein
MHRHFCASSFQVGAHTSMQGLIGVKSGFFTQRHFFASSVVSNGQNSAHTGGAAIEELADNVHTQSTAADSTIARSKSFLAENILISSHWAPKVVNPKEIIAAQGIDKRAGRRRHRTANGCAKSCGVRQNAPVVP